MPTPTSSSTPARTRPRWIVLLSEIGSKVNATGASFADSPEDAAHEVYAAVFLGECVARVYDADRPDATFDVEVGETRIRRRAGGEPGPPPRPKVEKPPGTHP